MTPDAPDGVPGRYYDGQTSRAWRVVLSVRDGHACIDGETERCAPLAEVRVSERSVHARRRLTFADQASFEADEQKAFDALLHATGHRDGVVVRLQQSWRLAVGALAATAAVLAVGYLFVLPAAADLIARSLPVSVERQMAVGVLSVLDRHAFAPSRLPDTRRGELARSFAQLAPPEPGAPAYQLLFRRSRIGPNAFALPSGEIVLTDEMVELLGDDKAVMAVLAHELGHLHARHLTRRLIQGSVVGATGAVLFGDVSTVVAGLPALALDLRYSRDAEQEADDYAADMLRRNGIASKHLERVFTVLQKLEEEEVGVPAYLSSHPASSERLARLRDRSR